MQTELDLRSHASLYVRQRREIAEWIGFETRNKYEILDQGQTPVAFAAEQQKGILGFLFRQFLGHWRTFEIHLFDRTRQPVAVARHPFRFFFQRLEVFGADGRSIGAVQQRFGILSKRLHVEDSTGRELMTVSSPIWRIWTFPFLRQGSPAAVVSKKWTGILSEVFTDKDTFRIDYSDESLEEDHRLLILAAAVFIDLQYFENKGGGPLGSLLDV